MKQVITTKLRPYPTAEQAIQLLMLGLAYREALNYVSRYAFENGKTTNQHKLQAGTYVCYAPCRVLDASAACLLGMSSG